MDIFSKFPVIGAHLECKDQRLEEFYSGLFFDEDGLNYHEFLVDIGREYYTSGEAWPFATFNEDLGIWDDEELLNPDDIKVERSPFLKEPRYFIRLPWTIRQILTTRQPAWEYQQAHPGVPGAGRLHGRERLHAGVQRAAQAAAVQR